MRWTDLRMAAAFAVLLVVVVGGRLLVVWLAGSSGWMRLAVSLVIIGVFVGVPAAYGLRGLIRGDGDVDGA